MRSRISPVRSPLPSLTVISLLSQGIAARAAQTCVTQFSAPGSSLNMGMTTQKLRTLPLDYVPDIPVAGVVAEIVALTLLERGGGEEHELQVGGQRHEAVGVARRY